jgi:hypothetical protein
MTMHNYAPTQEVPGMPQYFTVAEAFEAHEDGDPHIVNRLWATTLLSEHGFVPSDFFAEVPPMEGRTGEWDAWIVLSWMGY